ncbi:MAG: metalloregulator ArsR/SmtB family transcription factor [bacterium]
MEKLAAKFKALSDETRLRIMALLSIHGELCVCDFEGVLEISQSKSSRHLRYLWNAGLVQNRREGKWMYYRLPEAPDPACRTLLRTLDTMLDARLRSELVARLQAWFERKDSEGVKGCVTQPG